MWGFPNGSVPFLGQGLIRRRFPKTREKLSPLWRGGLKGFWTQGENSGEFLFGRLTLGTKMGVFTWVRVVENWGGAPSLKPGAASRKSPGKGNFRGCRGSLSSLFPRVFFFGAGIPHSNPLGVWFETQGGGPPPLLVIGRVCIPPTVCFPDNRVVKYCGREKIFFREAGGL